MKRTYLLLILSSVCFFSGCVSTVKTYDTYGNLTGTCKSYRGIIFGGGAHCYGYANPLDRTGKTLTEIPESYEIPLK